MGPLVGDGVDRMAGYIKQKKWVLRVLSGYESGSWGEVVHCTEAWRLTLR